jgi:hypothetical protein
MAAVSYAGDTLDGHPPITRRDPHAGVIIALVLALWAVVVPLARTAQARPGLVVDVACFGAMVAGVFLMAGTGPGLVAAGIAGLVVKDFGS